MKKIASLFFVCFLTACGGTKTYEPEEINPDIDVCVICNMSITAEPYATEIVLKDGTVHKFDDIGCMIEWMNEQNGEDIAKKYVRDVTNGKWIELEQAVYVYNPNYWTPMNYGVVSFANEKNAKEYMEQEGKGELWTYEQLKKHRWGFER
ncbi:nitrous oxide reductase accessory protein NosL [Anoxybacillus suryakundensis]|uniref:NosL n=1 Tax=Anoxybacillus suryakundensis TaxID=1325335 RepID=A0A0K6GND7_9BACL|nr:nitrous oxide reductase accessory protein NosL [Anoxybacillus suryakundensis]CUA80249.1 NosL [Anoxybacillus suryakundensis]